MVEVCPGCGAETEPMTGPIHRYMTSSPACWHRYGEVLQHLYQAPGLSSALVMCADTYAVQHPGSPNAQAIQSVAVHLVNLSSYLAHSGPVRIPQDRLLKLGTSVAAGERPWRWLTPPSFAHCLPVFDMPMSGTVDDVARAARAWAESVWAAWREHHAQVEEWRTHHVGR